MKKRVSAVILVLILVLGLTACESGNQPLRTDACSIIKGAKSDDDYRTNPKLSITYYADSDAQIP